MIFNTLDQLCVVCKPNPKDAAAILYLSVTNPPSGCAVHPFSLASFSSIPRKCGRCGYESSASASHNSILTDLFAWTKFESLTETSIIPVNFFHRKFEGYNW